jgi:hypothetical protein
MLDRISIIAIMNTLKKEQQAQILRCLVEGCSIRSTGRMTGASKDTILKLLKVAGETCLMYQDDMLRKVPCKLVQCDESEPETRYSPGKCVGAKKQ